MSKPKRVVVHSRSFGFRVRILDASWSSVNRLAALARERIEEQDMTYTALAKVAQLTPTTVSRFSRGATRWPRFKTVVGVLNGLGLEVTVSDQ